MKNARKLMACLLSLAMLPIIMPWQEKAEASTNLFVEDFESYPVGVISSGAAVDTITGSPPVRNPGELSYILSAGDTLEVVEKDGSKALKITIDNTIAGNRSIFLDFDAHYGGSNAYEVAFDYYVENNSVWLPDFGTLYDDKQSNIYYVHNTSYCYIKRVSSYKNALYFDGNTATYYAGNLVRSSDAIWRHQNTSIDFTQSPRPFTITTTKTADGTQLAKKSMTVDTALNDISSILWRFAKDNGSNGWNATDSGNAVFYIDNITVKRVELELASTNVANNGEIEVNNPFTMTFDSAVDTANVTLEKNGIAMAGADYTVTTSGTTVSVMPVGGWQNGATYTVNVGTVTAVSGIAPYQGATFTLSGVSYLFKEDFEGYSLGVIATGPENTVSTTRNPGGLLYKLVEGDKLEIVEKDGSKVLKLTVNNTDTTERKLLLDFNQHYGSGKAYDISFDYYVENNSIWFNDFGSVYDDKISGQSAYVHNTYFNPIKAISSYRNNLYFDRVTSPDSKFYARDMLAASDAFWKKQAMTIDFSQDPKPFTITTTKVSDGSRLAKKSLTVSQTFGKQTVDNVSSIEWGFQKNGNNTGWNGRDLGDGVYYFDNIAIKMLAQKYLSASVADGATGVAANTAVTLTFSEPVASASGIVVVQNGIQLTAGTDYTAAISDKTVTITSESNWRQGAELEISGTVTGTNTDISYTGRMLTFYTTGDYILSNVSLSGNTITAKLLNATAEDKACVAIGTQLDGSGNISRFDYTPITVESGATENISIEFTNSAPFYELYIWDNFDDINALTYKRTLSGS